MGVLMGISVKGLRKEYSNGSGSLAVLHGISLDLAGGELICLLGPSGCGKTTLLNILAGLDDKYEGDIAILGGRESSTIGYMFQADSLLPWRTVERNVTLGVELRGGRISQQRREQALGLLRAFGIESFSGSYPEQLSGGMKQKVALARTLLVDPAILLLDEPFAHLDFVSRISIAAFLRRYVMERGVAALVVSHSIEDAINMGTRVMVLHGRPAEMVGSFQVTAGSEEGGGSVSTKGT